MSEIKLGNGAEVLERLKRDELLNPNRNKTHMVLMEPSYCGEVDMEAVMRNVESNSAIIAFSKFDVRDNEQ